MKMTWIIILLAVIAAAILSDKWVKCRATKEGQALLDELVDEIALLNDQLSERI